MMHDTVDRSLLFGILALQAGVVEPLPFAQALHLWISRPQTSLVDLLIQDGLLTSADRQQVERALDQMLASDDQAVSLSARECPSARATPAAVTIPEQACDSTAEAAPPMTENQSPPGERYTLHRLHAAGGIGQVWLAHDPILRRRIALKRLRPDRHSDRTIVSRFVAEARITGQLEHPSIVPVYELVTATEDRSPFYTMRFIQGSTLAEAAARYHRRRQNGEAGPLELHTLLGAFVSVCNAVAYAHSRGVLHRDLKGSNIILGDYGEVILLDWGLAKVIRQTSEQDQDAGVWTGPVDGLGHTIHGQTMGTPGYMPPEQAQGELDRLDERSDVYGLGAVLYEILTGRAPFVGSHHAHVLEQVIRDNPPSPRLLVPHTPPALSAVCMKALMKEPAARYGSARELADEIRQWLAGEPVTAYPEPVRARVRRWLGKHRTLATASAASVLITTLLLASATVLLQKSYAREQQARGQAETNLQTAQANLQTAEENFALARQAVDQSFTAISESPQLKARGLEKLRQQLLQQAGTYYERFSRMRADSPELQAEQGRAYLRLATITAATGDRPKAIQICGQARRVFEGLLAATPKRDHYRDELAQVLAVLAENLRQNRQITAAGGVFEEAVTLRQQLAQDHPESAPYQYRLAMALRDLGDFYQLEANKFPESEATCKKAVGICQALVQAAPTNPDYRFALARSLSALAGVQSYTQPLPVAKKAFDQSIAEYARLLPDHPDVPEYVRSQGETYNDLGILFANDHRPADALPALTQALHIRERLVREHPDVTQYAQELADTRTIFAGCLALTGDYRRAARLIDKALAQAPHGYPLAQYNGACSYVSCLAAVLRDRHVEATSRQRLTDQYGARAVGLLREAKDMGFFQGPSRLTVMEADPDLAPLRSRADYQQLVKELKQAQTRKQ